LQKIERSVQLLLNRAEEKKGEPRKKSPGGLQRKKARDMGACHGYGNETAFVRLCDKTEDRETDLIVRKSKGSQWK